MVVGPWYSTQVQLAFANYNKLIRSRVSPTECPPPQHHPSNPFTSIRPTLRKYHDFIASTHPRRHYFSTSDYCNSAYASAAPELFLQRDSQINAGYEAINAQSWKELTDSLHEVLELPSMSFPAHHVHYLLSDKRSPIQPYLASHMAELEGVHPKIKLVREEGCRDVQQIVDQVDGTDDRCGDENPVQRRKRILLDACLTTSMIENADLNSRPQPSSPLSDSVSGKDDTLLNLTRLFPGIPTHILQRLVHDYDATPGGDTESIHIPYQHQPVSRILSKILSLHSSSENTNMIDEPPPSSYEQIGHVAHFNLRQPHLPYGKLIGRVMLDRLQPSIRTVVNKLGEVGGPYRTYAMDLLAGVDDYFVHVVEHGISLHFDLRKVYWCTRLEGERTYMIENEFRPNQRIADAFCGVGALCIRAAIAKGCSVVANDLNPDAVTYCKESARRNGIDISENRNNGRFHVQCGDASQFIMNLGMDVTSSDDELSSTTTSNLPDHLLLNYPLDSPQFLNALRWWPSGGTSSDKNCKSLPTTTTRVHVYTFSRGDGERSASEVAIDMVADGLLPEGGYVEPSKFRGKYLNELGWNIKAREIRDASPGKMVICVSFSVTRLLLRRMQGDYGLIRE